MEVVSNNYMPGDPRLVQQLVYELKSQGIFDQFRKECISDVDTKPAYQNLRQRVEGSVTSFLKQQTWRPDMNKNQVREQLRKSIYESGYLETGVERIVDQVVNPKINTVFLPQVEDVVYRYLGIEKPNRMEIKKELKIDVADLLPTDLEAVSPESDHTKEDSFNLSDSLNVDSKLEEDESPPFEPLDVHVQHNDVQQEENSVDSHLSGFSGLQSHDSNPCNEPKICPMELSNQDSQVSHNSSESHLSIITSEENTKMEICEESEPKFNKSIDTEERIEIPIETQTNSDKDSYFKKEDSYFKKESLPSFKKESLSDKDSFKKDVEEIKKTEKIEPERKDEKTFDDKKSEDKKVIEKKIDDKKSEEKKTDDKKHNERKSDDKKSRSSEKHSSKDRKDDKYKKSSSNSSSRDKDKSSSRHSSSTSSKDKDKSKEKKESKTSTSNNKDKVEKDKEKPEKDRSEKEKSKSEKDRERSDKDKSKSSSSSSSKHSNSKDKDKSHSSSKRESSGKDKDKSRSSSSSTSKESKPKSSHSESKSKSSSDKHKKDEKTSHNGKHSSSSSSLKKDKDRKRDSRKEPKDDHYSSKEKKNDRRSTDRDSNDGQSSRQSHSNSFTETSSNTQKNNQESSNSNSGSGSGDSGNSDQIEHTKVISPIKLSTVIENKEVTSTCADIQKFKYIKPKFASNFEEARKLMKIRKQLAKLERQNQLSLTQIEMPVELPSINGVIYPEPNIPEEVVKEDEPNKKPQTPERKEMISSPKEVTPMLQSTELSKENWEALEARLAQEMSNINYNSYESPYDYDYDYAGYNSIVISPRKSIVIEEKCIIKEVEIDKTPESPKPRKLDFEKRKEVPSENSRDILVESSKSPNQEVELPSEDSRDILVESPISPNQEVVIKKDSKNDLEKSRKLRVELETSIYKRTKGIVKIIKREGKITKNGDKRKADVIGVKKIAKDKLSNKKGNVKHSNHETVHKSGEKWESLSDIDYECRYLEAPSPSLENNLQFIRRHIDKLEREVEHSVKAIQNNFLPLKRVGRKRKLEDNVDFKNNNKNHYEQTTTEMKKRRRSIVPNPNSVILQANQEKMCNSTDISPNDSFSLPLSPAESDKSNDKKEDESPKLTKQKRNVIGRNTSTRSQRYSSDDLYKPRPIIIASTRRSRSAKNPGN